jgi:hypothetical protein
VSCGDKSTALLALGRQIAHDSSRFGNQTVRDMISPRQNDLFGNDQQDDLFEDQPTPVYRGDPDQVRAELCKILAEARAAQKMPWDSARVSLYRTIFPQMTNWLPKEEGEQLRFDFETELARLEAA